jgi:pimeloyl-ACP methyl ester carboxylesterase
MTMFIEVNGIRLYYEQTGSGAPIVLLHGNGEDHTIFDVLSRFLSSRFTVYAVDSRGHGQSTKTAALDYAVMARDVSELITGLNLEKPVLLGFSVGGIIGLLLGSGNPELISRLIVCGANTHPSGIRTIPLFMMKLFFRLSKNEKLKLMLTQPDIEDAALNRISVPTLVLIGSRDMIKRKHTEHIASEIPNARLSILEGESHSSYIVRSLKIVTHLLPFLEAE